MTAWSRAKDRADRCIRWPWDSWLAVADPDAYTQALEWLGRPVVLAVWFDGEGVWREQLAEPITFDEHDQPCTVRSPHPPPPEAVMRWVFAWWDDETA